MDAQARLRLEATANKGALTSSSRCYFISAPGDDGHVPIPVTNQLACGPVRLMNDSVRVPYLVFDLIATPSRRSVKLAVDRSRPAHSMSAPPLGQRLVRPDRVSPPDGAGDLTRPGAPPAIGDVLAKSAAVSPQPASSTISLVGRSSGVKLLAYGPVVQYGAGAEALSAPSGHRLIAFKVAPLAGEDGTTAGPALYVAVDGQRRGPLAPTDDYVVIAVPTSAKSVSLVLADPGGDQTVSLVTGELGKDVPLVTRRANRTATLGVDRAVNVKVAGAKGSGITSGRVSFKSVSLLYWAPDGSHAGGPQRALLQIVATMRLSGDKADFGVETDLLSAAGTGDTTAKARNAAAKGSNQIVAVVDVPADITSGTVTFRGTARIAGKGTITVLTPLTLTFTIPAG
jgi:hypothetical protein